MTLHVKAMDLLPEHVELLEKMEFEGRFSLREEEAREYFSAGLIPTEVIRRSASSSIEASLVFANEELVLIWGHGPMNRCGGVGSAWMISTPNILKHKRYFIRLSRDVIEYLMTIYSRLEVLVSARYLESIHWLKWLGFKVEQPAFMVGNEPIVTMWKERG